MKIEIEIDQIQTRKELKDIAFELQVRNDWHEPDEEGVSVIVTEGEFDNAGTEGEINVVLVKDGKPYKAINLATLFAFATGYEGE